MLFYHDLLFHSTWNNAITAPGGAFPSAKEFAVEIPAILQYNALKGTAKDMRLFPEGKRQRI